MRISLGRNDSIFCISNTFSSYACWHYLRWHMVAVSTFKQFVSRFYFVFLNYIILFVAPCMAKIVCMLQMMHFSSLLRSYHHSIDVRWHLWRWRWCRTFSQTLKFPLLHFGGNCTQSDTDTHRTDSTEFDRAHGHYIDNYMRECNEHIPSLYELLFACAHRLHRMHSIERKNISDLRSKLKKKSQQKNLSFAKQSAKSNKKKTKKIAQNNNIPFGWFALELSDASRRRRRTKQIGN